MNLKKYFGRKKSLSPLPPATVPDYIEESVWRAQHQAQFISSQRKRYAEASAQIDLISGAVARVTHEQDIAEALRRLQRVKKALQYLGKLEQWIDQAEGSIQKLLKP